MADRRVQFDFEIEFSNGGGLRGQGFRLDIEGDDIADEVLADYLVRDMRLLMVGEHLCGLERVPEAGFRFFAVPVKVLGLGTFPVRAFAVI